MYYYFHPFSLEVSYSDLQVIAWGFQVRVSYAFANTKDARMDTLVRHPRDTNDGFETFLTRIFGSGASVHCVRRGSCLAVRF